MPKPTFQQACAQYVHRYTMEHVPSMAAHPAPNGKYYAPHYATDREWYEKTVFPEETEHPDHVLTARNHCFSAYQTWPLGKWLDAPYTR